MGLGKEDLTATLMSKPALNSVEEWSVEIRPRKQTLSKSTIAAGDNVMKRFGKKVGVICPLKDASTTVEGDISVPEMEFQEMLFLEICSSLLH